MNKGRKYESNDESNVSNKYSLINLFFVYFKIYNIS